jgi:hypothetical protein
MKNCTKFYSKIYLMLLLLLGFGSNQRTQAQIVIAEIGYAPLGIFTNDIGYTKNVITLGANIMKSSTKMIGLTLDYSLNKFDEDEKRFDFFGSGKVAKLTYNSSLIRLNYTRYVFLVGELDVPFQCFLTGGYSLGFETRSVSLNNKDVFTNSEIDELKKDYYGFSNKSYIHMQIVLGVGMQYNFTRNIGLRGELNYGTGFSNTDEVISGSIFPKLSLCYKPDYIFR